MDTMDEEVFNNFDEKDPYHCSDEDDIEYIPPEIPHTAKKCRKTYKQIRPKVSTEWSHDDIMKLINAVEDRHTLWDVSSPQYKLPKTPAWQEIADSFEKRTADECKAKWANLRVTFKTNLTKSRKQKSGSAAGGSIVWKYFNAMMFLDVKESTQTSESISSMILQLSEDSISPGRESELSTSSEPKRGRKIPSVPTASLSPSRRSDLLKEIAAKALCTIAEKTKEKDQFDAFGTHVAAELHSLSHSKAVLAKRKMARALVDIMDEVESMPETEI